MKTCTHLYELLLENTVRSNTKPEVEHKITDITCYGKDYEGLIETTLIYKGLLIKQYMHISADLSRYSPSEVYTTQDVKYFDTMHAYNSLKGIHSDNLRITVRPAQDADTNGYYFPELGVGVYLGFNNVSEYNYIDIKPEYLKHVITEKVDYREIQSKVADHLNERAKYYIRSQADRFSELKHEILHAAE